VTLNGQGHDPKIFKAQYLGNRARHRFGVNGPRIGNYPLWVFDLKAQGFGVDKCPGSLSPGRG